MKMTRVSGTFRVYEDGVLQHTYSQTFTGPVGIAIGGHAQQDVEDFNWSGDNYGQFIDSGLATNDQVNDSPSDSAADDIGNYCVMNPLVKGGCTLSNGNLVVSNPADKGSTGTIAVSSGKWRFEAKRTTAQSPERGAVGITSQPVDADTDIPWAAGNTNKDDAYAYQYNGKKVNNGAEATYGDTYTGPNDVIDVFFDADNGTIWFAKNGTLQNSASEAEVEAGTTTNAAYSSMTFSSSGGHATPFVTAGGSGTGVWTLNFGQQAYANSYSSISLYKNLCTANLAAPAIKDPSKYFQSDNFSGTGSELARTLTDAGGSAFKPDLVWVKDLDSAVEHLWVDSARGATKELNIDATAAETTVAQGVKSFDTSGYTLGTDGNYNTSSSPNVAWCWRTQGGAGASNEGGSLNTTTTSVGATQGFSISTYTGTGSAATVGHGLGVAPEFICVKARAAVDSWKVYHSGMASDAETDHMSLNSDIAATDAAGNWNDTAPTSTVFSLGTDAGVNDSGATFVAYCWASVESYSKMGSFEGNANADGTFVWTGFRPAFLWIKDSDSVDQWHLKIPPHDTNVVDTYGLTDTASVANLTYSGYQIDFLSNGFKMRGTGTQTNKADTHIFIAFAEFPFGGSGVAQARAR
jgi:hypothetical protein